MTKIHLICNSMEAEKHRKKALNLHKEQRAWTARRMQFKFCCCHFLEKWLDDCTINQNPPKFNLNLKFYLKQLKSWCSPVVSRVQLLESEVLSPTVDQTHSCCVVLCACSSSCCSVSLQPAGFNWLSLSIPYKVSVWHSEGHLSELLQQSPKTTHTVISC